MTIIEMLEQSAMLTFVGMAVVFFFLWFLAACINFVGKIAQARGWGEDKTPSKKIKETTIKPEIVAAITAAVTEYRKNL